MSYSIPRNLSRPIAPGERRVTCDYCGAKWLRSQCRRDASGFIVCPDDDDGGRDQVTLDRLNQAAAAGADLSITRTRPEWW
jgi:hypothetical protein